MNLFLVVFGFLVLTSSAFAGDEGYRYFQPHLKSPAGCYKQLDEEFTDLSPVSPNFDSEKLIVLKRTVTTVHAIVKVWLSNRYTFTASSV